MIDPTAAAAVFNVVHFRAKPGQGQEFERTYTSLPRDMPGLKRFVLLKTGEDAYCGIGEWTSMDHMAAARPKMGGNLDRLRPLLQVLDDGVSVTSACSGSAVVDVSTGR
jgi:hypothetical protein